MLHNSQILKPKFKEEDGIPELPVVALTAYALWVDKKWILESGCDDHIVKPFHYKVLSATFQKYLI